MRSENAERPAVRCIAWLDDWVLLYTLLSDSIPKTLRCGDCAADDKLARNLLVQVSLAVRTARRALADKTANGQLDVFAARLTRHANKRGVQRTATTARIALHTLRQLSELIVECGHNVESSNENKMSDGWRDGASLRVEGGISSM